ncbi:TetR/AcrR family transcriptional regulator [Gordonia sp. ABSL1-1]|uniref:TetR/AcrR family transcriptional regulator n=1 Tax=Gordonia sp. ABSL1-1 TaxID=3053923 RepID=UPI0025732457|nr:TetR/AcrR family transcriptional regulator [Gordonia sp. ABSL1-1]MDL9937339.1 TetR/AcrR family transcriptional regulator [Gordonia sp. ABSL1-1]
MTSAERPELPRYLALLWNREPATPRRGPKPTLAISDIARAAVAIADESGWDAVSMKGIADALGVTTMSLYRYVDAKDDIHTIMIDEAFGRADPATTATGDWRTRVGNWVRAAAELMRRRPWIAEIPLSSPPLGPNTLSWTNSGVHAFADTGLSGQQKLSALLLVDGFVRHHVRQAHQMGLLTAGAVAGRPGYPELLAELADPGDYPDLAAAGAGMEPDDDFFTDQLEFGLGILLDGIAGLIQAEKRR